MEERELDKIQKIGKSVISKGEEGALKRSPENLAVGHRIPQGRKYRPKGRYYRPT